MRREGRIVSDIVKLLYLLYWEGWMVSTNTRTSSSNCRLKKQRWYLHQSESRSTSRSRRNINTYYSNNRCKIVAQCLEN